MDALIATGLRKRYGDVQALEQVDIAVAPGQVHGLLGPNGAGKTTLLRLILGLVRADAGSVRLFGAEGAMERPIPAGVAGLVEQASFYPYLSGRANLEVLAELDGLDAPEQIDRALAAVDLSGRSADRVGGYSSGMRQRLGIAAALLRSPRLLLLDEPTTGLDPAGIRNIGLLLRRLAEAGVAVLLSSHQMGEIEDLCDSYTVLSQGRVVWSGTAAAMREQAPASSHRMHTSDDARALALSAAGPASRPHLRVEPRESGGLQIAADEEALDAFVLELGASGVAVRSLELEIKPLEAMFFALTGTGPAQGSS